MLKFQVLIGAYDLQVVQYIKKINSDMVLMALFLLSHYFGGLIQCLGGALGAIVISFSAYKKGSLSKSGGKELSVRLGNHVFEGFTL